MFNMARDSKQKSRDVVDSQKELKTNYRESINPTMEKDNKMMDDEQEGKMVTKEFAEASAEINEILKYLPEEYINKIPSKLRDFFEKVEDKEYIANIDPYKTLDKQDLKPKTQTLLTILYREYWCNDEEKAELDKVLIENDKKYEEELREKYNPDNIFKKNKDTKEIETVEETALIEYENRSWYKKAIDFIGNIFRKIIRK